ncbi:MAG: V-type ATP synthase subunit A [Acidimicrobiia bacterium]|nr:V-type ATP synthase subunit A [Acidimicrobiia bacterium]
MMEKPGVITRVNGPVVHINGLQAPTRFEYVVVGEAELPGEVLAVDHETAVAQIYEYTGGLRVGDPAGAAGHPLTVRLGPGLLGGIYDGLLRPLDDADEFIGPRGLTRPAVTDHDFEPEALPGTEMGPGDIIGRIARPAGGIDHLVVVPPDLAGTLEHIVEPGRYRSSAVIATIDGNDVTFTSEWALRRARPYRSRNPVREPFRTGQRVLDVLVPIAKGNSATVIGGFGEGKTMLLEQLAKWGDADVIIYVGCGERGNELTDLISELGELADPRTGRSLMERTIILANTSNMPVMAREASIYTAVTIAEYYRDMGYHAVIIADSTSRWAEAQRELASRTGAIPAEEGYPADLPASLAAFYQRAGRVDTLGGRDGIVTIVTSVSPPGGDVTEPVAAHTQRFVQAVWSLDRDLAYARHYPAVSWRNSFSRDRDAIGRWHAANDDPDWVTRNVRLNTLLGEADRLQGIADLVGLTALPTDERLILLTGRNIREAILQQSALSDNDAFCSPAKQAALTEAVLQTHDTATTVAAAGVPASVIEDFDYTALLRAKDITGPDDAAGVEAIAQRLRAALQELAP